MAFDEKYLDVLQNIEFPIQLVYKTEKDLTDYDALAAIECMIEFYTAEVRQREPRKFNLSEKSVRIYNGVKKTCDFRIGKNISDRESSPAPISLPEMFNDNKKINRYLDKTKWPSRFSKFCKSVYASIVVLMSKFQLACTFIRRSLRNSFFVSKYFSHSCSSKYILYEVKNNIVTQTSFCFTKIL